MQPITRKQGDTFYNAQTGKAEGIVNFDSATGNRLKPGQTTTDVPINMTPNANNLGNVKSIVIPPPDTSLTTDNLTIANNGATSGIKTDSTTVPPPTPTDTGKSKLKTYAEKLFGNAENQAAEEEQIRKDADLEVKRKKAESISNELDVLDKNFRDEAKTIRDTFGGTTTGASAALTSAQTKYEDRRANIALAYKVANQDYQGAEELVNQKIASLDKQFTREVQAFNLFKDSVFDDLTESEKIQAEEQSRIRTDKAKALTDTYSKTLQTAVDNNAPASVLSAIDEAARNPNATPASIATAAGRYSSSTEETSISTKLSKNKGGDGYVDPFYYAELRSGSKMSSLEFDRKFGYLVNPVSKERFGVGTGVAGTTNAIADAQTQQILSKYGVSTIDELLNNDNVSIEDLMAIMNSLK